MRAIRIRLPQSATNVGVTRAYSFGGSSTGMYQREFLYLGFNEDGAHRKVFDALWIHKPGTHRLFANVEFADPNTYSARTIGTTSCRRAIPRSRFAVSTDPISKVRDGLVKRPQTDPLVFQSDTENEFWEMKASLNVTDGIGQSVPIPDNVRLYFLPVSSTAETIRPPRSPDPRAIAKTRAIRSTTDPSCVHCWWRSTPGPTGASSHRTATIPRCKPARWFL